LRRAVFIDALGTILWMAPPWQRVDPGLIEGIPAERVREAFLAEIAYYMERTEEGRDAASLADLRRRCADVLAEGLGREVSVEQMLDSLAFTAFDDARPALEDLRGRGLTLVCVSNWDCSLPDVLERIGLGGLFDGVVTSALAGVRKPDPAIFAPALEIAGCEPVEALHVGDSDDDLTAARAAGIEAVLIDRSGTGGGISSLAEIPEHLER
jgi:putative hydrolase of the HAD superfamily